MIFQAAGPIEATQSTVENGEVWPANAIDDFIQTAEFKSLGYKLVDGEWTRPDDPTWNLPRQQRVDT